MRGSGRKADRALRRLPVLGPGRRCAAAWFVAALWLLCAAGAPAQEEPFSFEIRAGDVLKITEKANLRKYENGRFVGLSYREVRGILEAVPAAEAREQAARAAPDPAPSGPAPELAGRFYVFEETKHDTALVAKRIDRIVPSRLAIDRDGSYRMDESTVYPALRSFPVFPEQGMRPGLKWEAYGTRVVEPFRDEVYTRVRFYCGYEYRGTETREGREYHVVAAQYAMRHKQGQDPYGDERIQAISGKHVVKIYYDAEGRRPSFMQDVVDESYQLAAGGSLGFKGFILTWFDGVFPMDRLRVAEELEEELKRALGESGAEDVTVGETEEGVALTLGRILFASDRAVILPEEQRRLAAVAAALAKIPERTFLVVGHTADVGRPEEEYTLSVERAKAVVDAMVAQGLEARRFLYEGRGSTQPVAPNDTEENMARNRRVEIIILED